MPDRPPRAPVSQPDPRKTPASGYPAEEPEPRGTPPKGPGEGDPHEHQNDPDQKPGHTNP